MTRRRLIPPKLAQPDSGDHEQLRWLSDMFGWPHDAESITRVLDAWSDGALWLPEHGSGVADPPYIFQDVLQPEVPLLISGKRKTLKSSILAHIAVATAAKLSLFGHFGVDPSLCGPVLLWQLEGGSNYVLSCLTKACDVYGVRYQDLPIEIHTIAMRLDSAPFLYKLAARAQALRPALVVVEPLYPVAPGRWDGTKLLDFNLSGFTNIGTKLGFVPGIGHHDRKGDATGMDAVVGAGPMEWAGQWVRLDRPGGDWTGRGDHELRMTYGGRGAGGGQVGLRIDDDTLTVEVIDAEDMAAVRPAKEKTYEALKKLLPHAFNDGEVMASGEMFDHLSGSLEARTGRNISGSSLKRSYLKLLLQEGELQTVEQSGNTHTLQRPTQTHTDDGSGDDG